MAERLLLGIAEGIIKTLGSPAVEEISLLWGVQDEVERLANTVSTIKDVLLDGEEKQVAGDHAVTGWLGRLEDAMYDADDLLDVVSTDAQRREIMTRDKKAKQVRIFFSESNQLVYRLKMAHKIKAMRERLDAIDKDGQRFHLEVRRQVETRVGGSRGDTHSFVHAEAVIGRDADKKAVIDRLLLDSNVEDNVSILPIVAIGGLGKTTLAQLIFNDEQIENHFQLKMWVCVSDPFHVKNIVEKIIEDATKEKPKTGEMNTLVRNLKEKIDGKKYLLVLDDVWNDDYGKWFELKQVLMGGARGSRILLTTRSEIVARISGTVQSHFLRGLEEHDSWSLFKQIAFGRGQELKENSSIVAIGKEILEKCSGVPLAIRTIGSLLRFNNSEAEWLAFKEKELSKISQKENEILPTLKLSYDYLPSHLKHCFAYCSLYPKDYKFNKSTLIQLWTAQGFVKSSDQNQCLEDVGNEYFMDLLWRSFFQEAKMDEFGNVIECKMHDLMHDLAISVAGSMITTLDDDKESNISEKTRHVSIVGDNINTSSITTSLSKASRLRTFISLFGESDCEANFPSSKFLRVLVLHQRNLYVMQSSIGKLKHLRYLDLSWNYNLKMLPNSITRLHNLQTLILSDCSVIEELPRDIQKLVNLKHLYIDGCSQLTYIPCGLGQNLQILKLSNCKKLEELPGDIQKLVNLKHLYIDGCFKLTYMPLGLGQLTNLQTLSNFVVHEDPLCRHSGGLKELNKLNNLRGNLVIENLRHGKNAMSEFKAANLKEKQHLHALDLRWSIEEDVIASDDEVLLEVLQPHLNLKRLRLEGNYGSRLPTWLLSLTNLVRFELAGCRKCQYLPPLNQLPSLKVLHLFRMDALEYISSGSGDSNEFSSFFPSLEEIWLSHCPNLKGWWRRRDSSVEVNSDSDISIKITEHPLLPSFPRLSKLHIHRCPMLTSMPMFPHLEEELILDGSSSKPLQQTMMMNMAAPQSPMSTATTFSSFTPLSKLNSIYLFFIADLETLPEDWLENLTSLKSLKIQSCDRLNSLSPGIQHLTALQDLLLYNCPELELVNDEDVMQWQGLKSLISLELSQLPKLVSLPLGLQHGTTIQSLKISKCENLTAIPEWIHNCTSLQKLKIYACASLTSLPEGIRSLTSLEIRSCNRLNSLSPGIQHLTALQDLGLQDCPELELAKDEDGMQWQGLKSLLSLGFSQLPKLVSLPLGLQHATTLQSLKISNCENLTAIPEWIHNCTSLQKLQIDECASLTSLPEGIRSLTSLQRLKIVKCPILLQRCEREVGEDWAKIAHIPELELRTS